MTNLANEARLWWHLRNGPLANGSGVVFYLTGRGHGPASGENRVIRGGSWNNNARICRSANRNRNNPENSNNNIGFRVATAPKLEVLEPACVPSRFPAGIRAKRKEPAGAGKLKGKGRRFRRGLLGGLFFGFDFSNESVIDDCRVKSPGLSARL